MWGPRYATNAPMSSNEGFPIDDHSAFPHLCNVTNSSPTQVRIYYIKMQRPFVCMFIIIIIIIIYIAYVLVNQ